MATTLPPDGYVMLNDHDSVASVHYDARRVVEVDRQERRRSSELSGLSGEDGRDGKTSHGSIASVEGHQRRSDSLASIADSIADSLCDERRPSLGVARPGRLVKVPSDANLDDGVDACTAFSPVVPSPTHRSSADGWAEMRPRGRSSRDSELSLSPPKPRDRARGQGSPARHSRDGGFRSPGRNSRDGGFRSPDAGRHSRDGGVRSPGPPASPARSPLKRRASGSAPAEEAVDEAAEPPPLERSAARGVAERSAALTAELGAAGPAGASDAEDLVVVRGDPRAALGLSLDASCRVRGLAEASQFRDRRDVVGSRVAKVGAVDVASLDELKRALADLKAAAVCEASFVFARAAPDFAGVWACAAAAERRDVEREEVKRRVIEQHATSRAKHVADVREATRRQRHSGTGLAASPASARRPLGPRDASPRGARRATAAGPPPKQRREAPSGRRSTACAVS